MHISRTFPFLATCDSRPPWNMKNIHKRRNTLDFRGFRGILSGHVSIGWILDTFLFQVHSRRATRMDFTVRRDDVVPRQRRTELSMSRMYSCTTATSWRITAGHCYCDGGKFFNFQAARNSKAAVIIRKGLRAARSGGHAEGHVTLIQEPCPCKWV